MWRAILACFLAYAAAFFQSIRWAAEEVSGYKTGWMDELRIVQQAVEEGNISGALVVLAVDLLPLIAVGSIILLLFSLNSYIGSLKDEFQKHKASV